MPGCGGGTWVNQAGGSGAGNVEGTGGAPSKEVGLTSNMGTQYTNAQLGEKTLGALKKGLP